MTKSNPETPAAPAHLEWIWVLAAPETHADDALLALEMDDRGRGARRTLPVFENKDQALAIRERLCPDQPESYEPQAMPLSDATRFAAEHRLDLLLLDQAGTILARIYEPGR